MRICDSQHAARTGTGLPRILQRFGLALLLTFAMTGVRADGVSSVPQKPPWTILEQRTGRGEQCLVCGSRIYEENIVEIRLQGRTFHVAAGDMFDLFAHDPQRYFHKFQTRSVLFDETSIVDRPMSIGWLIFGIYVLVGLICSAVCGYMAVTKALDPLPWFFAGLVGNVGALIVLAIMPRGNLSAMPAGVPAGLTKVPATRPPVRCRGCGTENHPSASRCDCGAALNAIVESEIKRL